MELKFTAGDEIHTLVIPDDMVFRGDLRLLSIGLKKLPDLSGVTVTGDFDCSCNELVSLQGAPKSVGGNFDCSYNKLTSLQGAPQSVGGDFDCFRNRFLISLNGVSQEIGGKFICGNKRLVKEYEEKKLACFAVKQKQKKK